MAFISPDHKGPRLSPGFSIAAAKLRPFPSSSWGIGAATWSYPSLPRTWREVKRAKKYGGFRNS